MNPVPAQPVSWIDNPQCCQLITCSLQGLNLIMGLSKSNALDPKFTGSPAQIRHVDNMKYDLSNACGNCIRLSSDLCFCHMSIPALQSMKVCVMKRLAIDDG